MTDMQLALELVNELEGPMRNIGDAVLEDLEIDEVRGNTIFITGTIPNTSHHYQNAVIEITNSDTAKKIRMVVVRASGNEVVLTRRFSRRMRPQAGDKFKLWGGPLAEAVVYIDDPDTILSDIQDGKRFFVTVSAEEGDLTPKGFGGRDRDTDGLANSELAYGFQVTTETPYTTGEPTPDDALRVRYELPTLREQVVTILYRFRVQDVGDSYGTGSIAWVNLILERAASRIYRAALIQFDIILI